MKTQSLHLIYVYTKLLSVTQASCRNYPLNIATRCMLTSAALPHKQMAHVAPCHHILLVGPCIVHILVRVNIASAHVAAPCTTPADRRSPAGMLPVSVPVRRAAGALLSRSAPAMYPAQVICAHVVAALATAGLMAVPAGACTAARRLPVMSRTVGCAAIACAGLGVAAGCRGVWWAVQLGECTAKQALLIGLQCKTTRSCDAAACSRLSACSVSENALAM